jgi:hypothetical protein
MWFFRNVFQVCDGGRFTVCRMRETVRSDNLPEAFAQAGDADADDHLLDALTQPGREAASFIADLELDSSHENEDDFSTSEFRLISPN